MDGVTRQAGLYQRFAEGHSVVTGNPGRKLRVQRGVHADGNGPGERDVDHQRQRCRHGFAGHVDGYRGRARNGVDCAESADRHAADGQCHWVRPHHADQHLNRWRARDDHQCHRLGWNLADLLLQQGNYGWGGYLIYRFYPEPNRRVFSFGEATLLGTRIMQQVSDVETGNADWQQIFAEWGIDYVIDVPGAPAVLALEVDPQWTKEYDDGFAVIMVKNSALAAAARG